MKCIFNTMLMIIDEQGHNTSKYSRMEILQVGIMRTIIVTSKIELFHLSSSECQNAESKISGVVKCNDFEIRIIKQKDYCRSC